SEGRTAPTGARSGPSLRLGWDLFWAAFATGCINFGARRPDLGGRRADLAVPRADSSLRGPGFDRRRVALGARRADFDARGADLRRPPAPARRRLDVIARGPASAGPSLVIVADPSLAEAYRHGEDIGLPNTAEGGRGRVPRRDLGGPAS